MMPFSSRRSARWPVIIIAMLLMLPWLCAASPVLAFGVTHYAMTSQPHVLEAATMIVLNEKVTAPGVARSPIELLPNYQGEPVVQLLPNHDTDDDVLCFVNADVPPTTTQPAVVLAATGPHKAKKVSLKTCRRSKVKAKEVQVSLRKRGCGRRHLLLHRRMC